MSFIKEFINRGYFYQCTDIDKLASLMEEKSIIAYIGFDCTASSLHVGNLMQIMILRLLQQYGHKPIVIIGGATSKIGDPTDKDEMRKFLSEEEIQHNIKGIKKSLSKFLRFGEGETDAIILNNSTWLESINYIEFLRDCGKLISINRMLTLDSIKSRLDREQSLSFLEFNYMILQAFDFSYLNKNYNCVLQLGGSDQWGNIISGVELTRKLNSKEVFGLTTPLLTTASGVKMGKSLGGAVWLNEDLLSPYKYYQYWRNCEDPDVVRFAKLYTEYNERELEEFEALSIKNINSAKKQLAYRLTELCHGKVAANEALETSIKVFEEGGIDENLPTQYIPHKKITQGVPAFELFFEAGLCSSKSEARKLIRGNGAKINDQKIEDENMIINEKFIINGLIKLSTGKKNHKLLKLT